MTSNRITLKNRLKTCVKEGLRLLVPEFKLKVQKKKRNYNNRILSFQENLRFVKMLTEGYFIDDSVMPSSAKIGDSIFLMFSTITYQFFFTFNSFVKL